MKKTILAAALCFAIPAGANEYKAGAIHIDHAWARPTLGTNPNSAAYLELENHGEAGDRLLGVASPVAERVELHMVLKEGAVMRMRPVEGGLDLPAGEEVVLEPGGLHVMLMGLTRILAPGETFPLTLTFEKAGPVEVEVTVQSVMGKAPAAKPMSGTGPHGNGHHDGGHHDGGHHDGDRPAPASATGSGHSH